MFEVTSRGVEMYKDESVDFNKMLETGIKEVLEDEEYYYIKLYTDDNFDNSWYLLNKKTNEVRWTYVMDLFDIWDSLKPVNIDQFRKAV